MRRGARARWLGLALSLVLAIAATSGCDRKEEVAERAPRVGDVAGGLVVARVGGLAVTADQVRETAKTRRIDVRAALDALVDDALAASSRLCWPSACWQAAPPPPHKTASTPTKLPTAKYTPLTTWLTAPPCNRWRAAIAP